MPSLDDPIQSSDDDLLDRAGFATNIAINIQNQQGIRESGLVVAIMGPWGCGKTSLLNLTCNELQRNGIHIINFNPWIFSGTKELVGRFFLELESQLRKHKSLRKLAASIARYGEMLEPVSKKFGILKLLRRRSPQEKGLQEYQCQIKSLLCREENPIVVAIDDIDRLSNPEIKDILRLVRLTANFPNLIFILLFDRKRVELALNNDGIMGPDYIDKIVQIGIDVPSISSDRLSQCTVNALNEILQSSGSEASYNQGSWIDLFDEIIRPLIRNIRDLRRYTCSAEWTTRRLNGRVSVTDVLALEAIRMFMPNIYLMLPRLTRLLTRNVAESHDILDNYGKSETDILNPIKQLIDGAKDENMRTIIEAMIYRLFPENSHQLIGRSTITVNAHSSWLRDRRVASEPILRLYLENFESGNLISYEDATRVLRLNDSGAITQFLQSLDPYRMRDAIYGLNDLAGPFTVGWIRSLMTSLYNLIPTIPSLQVSIVEHKPHEIVNSVVYSVLVSAEIESVSTVIRKILPSIDTLSSKLFIVFDLCRPRKNGLKLVSVEESKELEAQWFQEFCDMSTSKLAREWYLLGVLLQASKMSRDMGRDFFLDDSAEMTLAILRSAQDEVVSQDIHSSGLERYPRLSWDAIESLYCSSDKLQSSLKSVRESACLTEQDRNLLEMATKYLNGWRPTIFDD